MGGESRYWSSGPIRVFFFACLLYEHGVYTRDTCSKSKFYLRTMRGKVVSRSTGLRGGHEHPKRISNAHVRFDHLSLSLPPPSRPLVAYVVHRLKPNSTATVLKGFFFSFLHVANLPYAGRNKRQCTASPLSACKGVRVSIGAKLRAFCTRNVTCGFFKSTRNSAIMNKGKTRERENCIDISICVNYARERERGIISKRPRNFCCDGMGIVIDRIYKRSRNLYVLRCQLLED